MLFEAVFNFNEMGSIEVGNAIALVAVGYLIFSGKPAMVRLPCACNYSQLIESGTILMEARGSSLRVGTSRSQSLNGDKVSALCILWKTLHSLRN